MGGQVPGWVAQTSLGYVEGWARVKAKYDERGRGMRSGRIGTVAASTIDADLVAGANR